MEDTNTGAAIVTSLSLRDHFAMGAGVLPTPHRVMAPPTSHITEADYEDTPG